jgi:lipopolysaccharide export system protein LptA
MKRSDNRRGAWSVRLLAALLTLVPVAGFTLESDRQQPLDVKADATEGTLGDGTATLRGNVEISQGSLLIRADIAEVEKVDGRVRRFELNGDPVHLQQEIENEGLVVANARQVVYEVASGMVTLTGAADVTHPQYHIAGDVLKYDMNIQHFQGSGGDGNGRLRIRLDPEVVPGNLAETPADEAGDETPPESEDGGQRD